MSAHIKKAIFASQTINSDTTTTSSATEVANVHAHANQFIALSTVSSRTDGTFTTTIQHSPDGTNWYTLAAGSAQSANGTEVITVASTVTVFQFLRASVLSASTTTGATVEVNLYHGVQR
jgi:hypothetical protein